MPRRGIPGIRLAVTASSDKTPDAPRKYAIESMFGDSPPLDLTEHIPHCRRLGLEVVSLGPSTATVKIPYSEELVGDPSRGVVFGGVITTLLDQTCGMATLCSLEEFETIATIDLRIDYLRAAEAGRDLIGRGECYKLTRHVAFLRGIAYESSPEEPFATCIGTFMVGSRPSEHFLTKVIAERDSDEPTERE